MPEGNTVRPCNLHIVKTLKLTEEMIHLADRGEADREEGRQVGGRSSARRGGSGIARVHTDRPAGTRRPVRSTSRPAICRVPVRSRVSVVA